MPSFLSDINKNVKQTLQKRQKLFNYSFGDDVDYSYFEKFNQKTAWATVMSNAEVKINGKFSPEKARNNTLTNIKRDSDGNWLTKFSDHYQIDDDNNSLRHYPVLTSLNVENRGKLGSLRKSTIEFKCFSMQDLHIYSQLYMCPGMSCFIQWGWSPFSAPLLYDDEQLIKWLTTENGQQLMQEYIFNQNGYYDALIGIITSFTWTVEEDGSIQCTVELTSEGFSMTNLNFNDMPIDYSITSTNDKDKKVGVTLKSFIIDELKDIVVDFENINDVYTNDENMAILFARNFYHFKGAGGDGSKHRWYINLQQILYLCWYFINYNNNKSDFKIFPYMQRFNQLDKDDLQTRSYYTEGIKNPSSNFNFRSLDREKVVLPSIFFEYDSDYPLSDIDMREEYGEKRQNFDNMYIGHIFIRVDEVVNAFKVSNTLEEALKSLLSIINTTVGNVWQLQLLTDDYGTHVVDEKKNSITDNTVENDNTLQLTLYGSNSIVTDFSMQSNLPDSMKAVSLYSINGGNNSNDNTVALRTAFGDLRDRRRKDNKNASLDDSESLSNEQLKKKDEIAKETLKKLNKALKKSNKLTIDGQYRDMIIASWKKNLYVEKGNTFKYDNGEWFIYEKKYDQTTDNETVDDGKNHTNINAIIPINLSLTIDGIGGIYYGNRIQVDYLPENYKNRDIKFQITNVQHTIENNNWKTSLETLMRVL